MAYANAIYALLDLAWPSPSLPHSLRHHLNSHSSVYRVDSGAPWIFPTALSNLFTAAFTVDNPGAAFASAADKYTTVTRLRLLRLPLAIPVSL